MKKMRVINLMFVAVMLLFWSCQSDDIPTTSNGVENSHQLTKLTGTAYLYLDIIDAGNKKINIYMLTEDWNEDEVSWNNPWSKPGGVFDEDHVVSVTPASPGLLEINITKFANQWATGKENFGLILKLDDTSVESFNRAWSKDNPYNEIKPYAIIFVDGKPETFPITADSYMRAKPSATDNLYGDEKSINTSFLSGYEIRGILKFDIPDNILPEEKNCVRTKSYWKTHAKGKKKDPIWDLLPNGTKTKFFKSKKSYHNIISRKSWGNPYYVLASEYAATELNILSGASSDNIKETFEAAAEMLKSDPKKLKKMWKDRKFMEKLMGFTSELRAYNMGEGGVDHCDDYKWKKDDKEWKKWWDKKWGKWKKKP
ncbi:MAG: DNRLRE domain-containing protein [Melioribacteraceae bacterium]|nr:DNRLRE domain-containing protein [Melioribacteraceae bacterium]